MSVVHVVGAAIFDRGRCLVAQRGPAMSSPGLWEFPGGKVEGHESPRAALERELGEELGIRAHIGDWLGRGECSVAGRRIVLDVYAASVAEGTPHPHEHAELRWLAPGDFDALEWAPADVPVLPAVAARLRAQPDARPRG